MRERREVRAGRAARRGGRFRAGGRAASGVAAAALLSALAACGPQKVETAPPRPADYPAEGGRQGDEGTEGTARLIRAATTSTYRVYVANESSDNVMRVAFTPGEGARVEKTIPVGIMPGDIDGAHGIAVSPAGDRWYVTVAHGTPYGYLWQFTTGEDSLTARTELGLFPATMGLTPDGSFLLAVNFNLHGDMVPSDVSVVYTEDLTEMARVTTCLMPHGSRVNAAGTKHYSACMHSDQVVEIGLEGFEVTRRYSVAPGRERPLALSDTGEPRETSPATEDFQVRPEMRRTCSPTWVEPARGRRANNFLYVACNKNDEVLEISTETWEITRRFATGRGPYNLEVTDDGRWLVATLKGEQKVAFFDLDSGEEVGRTATSRPVTHGVVASPDGRWAFVTNEAVGSTRGTLDVFDLRSRELVATVELGYQSGGIDFWETRRAGG